MIMAGLELYGEDKPLLTDEEIAQRIPFKNVFIHGLIRDEKGRKMSKSLGNSPDPLDLIEKFGADGLRFGICNIAPTGSDILFSEERIQIGRNFCNKLWNAARFRQMSGPMSDNSSLQAILRRIDSSKMDAFDHWILLRLSELTDSIEKCFSGFELAPLTHEIYAFFWGDFCDWYIEASKNKLSGDHFIEGYEDNCLAIQDLVFRQLLQLANPVIPHITEELWEKLGYNANSKYIQESSYAPSICILDELSIDRTRAKDIDDLQDLIKQARALKAKYNLGSKRDVRVYYSWDPDKSQAIAQNDGLIRSLAGIGELVYQKEVSVEGLPAAVTPLGTIYLDLSSSIDVEAEKLRLSKELDRLDRMVAAGESKLKNPKFVEGAPAHVVEGARKQLVETTEKRDETKRILGTL